MQFWAYAFGHLVNGRLGEIIGANKLIISGMVLSAAMNLLIGFQSSLLVITILWGINGYVQSMLWSPGMSLIANWWPSDRRGFVVGFANAFSGLGTAATAFAVALSMLLFAGLGWRAAFIGAAIVMIAVVSIYPLFAKGSPPDIGLPEYIEHEAKEEANEKEIKELASQKGKLYPYVHLLKQWKFDLWIVIIMCSNVAVYGLLTWIPTYYMEVFGVDIEKGIIGSVVYLLGMAAGALIIPWLSNKVLSGRRTVWVIMASAGAILTVFGFMNQGPGAVASILLFFAGFFVYGINILAWTFAADIGGRCIEEK